MSGLDFLLPFYEWIKALHIISVISWMAALLYLPRLFVYHASEAGQNPHTSETLKVMERRLLKAIMTPAMAATWIFGILLVLTPGAILPGLPFWFVVKFLAVLAMSGFHGWLTKRQKEFAADQNERSERTFRLANEVPTVLMIVIVIMVIVRPF